MKVLIFKKIKFLIIKKNSELKNLIKKNGVFIFPSGPGLATIDNKTNYYNSLKKADYVFFDSGYFVLLLRFLKNIRVNKFSGFRFINYLFNYIQDNKNQKIFLINPDKKNSKKNLDIIKNLGVSLKNIKNYVAPIYNDDQIEDFVLLEKLHSFKPKIILINIGGGIQEILACYLKEKIKFKSKIICTGAAISFFTGEQAPIKSFFDYFYLGWLVRIIFNPKIFFIRYFRAINLFRMVYVNNANVKNFKNN